MIVVILLIAVANNAVSSCSIETTNRTNSEIVHVENKIHKSHTRLIAKHELIQEKLVDESGLKDKRVRRGGDELDDYLGREVGDDSVDYYNEKPWLDLDGGRKSVSSFKPQQATAGVSSNDASRRKTEEKKKVDHEFTEMYRYWRKILSRGLGKNRKVKLLTTMLSSQCFNITAPKLNPDVESLLMHPARTLDKRLEAAQNQLGTAIAGLVHLTMNVIDMDKAEISKKLSRALQILLDLHHLESINRRRLIIPQLNENKWNVPKGAKRRQYLFGENEISSITRNREKSNSSKKKKKPQQSQQERQEDYLEMFDAGKTAPFPTPDSLK